MQAADFAAIAGIMDVRGVMLSMYPKMPNKDTAQ
jgi:hypothetical protein